MTGAAPVTFASGTRGYRGIFVGLLVAVMAVSVFSIPAYAVLSGYLIHDFDLSRAQLGLLVMAVSLTTGLTSPLSGRVVDRIGGRRAVLVVLTVTAVSATLVALAPTFEVLLSVSVVAGVANGANNPVTNRLIVEHVPKAQQGLIMGTKQSGVQAAMLVLGIALPPLAVFAGWRAAIAVVSAVAVLALVVAVLVLPPDAAGTSESRAGAKTPLPRAMWWLALYSFLMGGGGAVLSVFLPLFAHEVLDWSLQSAALTTAVMGLIGVVARVVVGARVGSLTDYTAPLAWLGVGSAVAAFLVLASAHTGPAVLGVAVVLGGLTVATWNVIAMLAAVAFSPAGRTGGATGVVVFGFMTGFSMSPVLFGWSVDATGSYNAGWTGAAVLFLLAGVVPFASVRRAGKTPASDGSYTRAVCPESDR